MDEPVRSRLRPARHRGLTRPDPVTALPWPQRAARHHPPSENPGQAAEQASGGKAAPPENHQDQLSAGRHSKTSVRIYAVDRSLASIHRPNLGDGVLSADRLVRS